MSKKCKPVSMELTEKLTLTLTRNRTLLISEKLEDGTEIARILEDALAPVQNMNCYIRDLVSRFPTFYMQHVSVIEYVLLHIQCLCDIGNTGVDFIKLVKESKFEELILLKELLVGRVFSEANLNKALENIKLPVIHIMPNTNTVMQVEGEYLALRILDTKYALRENLHQGDSAILLKYYLNDIKYKYNKYKKEHKITELLWDCYADLVTIEPDVCAICSGHFVSNYSSCPNVNVIRDVLQEMEQEEDPSSPHYLDKYLTILHNNELIITREEDTKEGNKYILETDLVLFHYMFNANLLHSLFNGFDFIDLKLPNPTDPSNRITYRLSKAVNSGLQLCDYKQFSRILILNDKTKFSIAVVDYAEENKVSFPIKAVRI